MLAIIIGFAPHTRMNCRQQRFNNNWSRFKLNLRRKREEKAFSLTQKKNNNGGIKTAKCSSLFLTATFLFFILQTIFNRRTEKNQFVLRFPFRLNSHDNNDRIECLKNNVLIHCLERFCLLKIEIFNEIFNDTKLLCCCCWFTHSLENNGRQP